MDIDAYLRRIGYDGLRTPSLETLRAIQSAHFRSVPFETLNIHLGRPLSIDEDRIFDKVVTRRRGGWCHELNGLWARALRELGFQVDVLAASVVSPAVVPRPFGHCTVLVHLEEPWLSDVGFGARAEQPLRLHDAALQAQGEREFRLSRDGADWHLVCHEPFVSDIGLRFTLHPREFEEFRETADWQQTAPESRFSQRPIATLPTPHGRLNLIGRQLAEVRHGERFEEEVASEADLDALLGERFGLHLGEHRWQGFPWS